MGNWALRLCGNRFEAWKCVIIMFADNTSMICMHLHVCRQLAAEFSVGPSACLPRSLPSAPSILLPRHINTYTGGQCSAHEPACGTFGGEFGNSVMWKRHVTCRHVKKGFQMYCWKPVGHRKPTENAVFWFGAAQSFHSCVWLSRTKHCARRSTAPPISN